jgi:hypothetical protein
MLNRLNFDEKKQQQQQQQQKRKENVPGQKRNETEEKYRIGVCVKVKCVCHLHTFP